MAMAASSRREFFQPHQDLSDVSFAQLARGARTCVPACLALLGLPSHLCESYSPKWHQLLSRTSQMDLVIRSFNSLDELKVHLDYLFVAHMNTNATGVAVGHAAVLYREEEQMGSMKCTMFNPGSRNPFSTLDLNRSRAIDKWNNICAAFLPGTHIPAKEVETIDLFESDDEKDDTKTSVDPSRASPSHPSSVSPQSISSQERALLTVTSGQDSHERVHTPSPRGSSARQLTPSPLQEESTQHGCGGDVIMDTQDEYNTRRTTLTRAAKRPASSGFYEEVLREISPGSEYHRVTAYKDNGSIAERELECTKEMIGQHIARYLHNSRSWVVWYHLDTQRFVIAKTSAISGYDIEGAEEGKDRFVGYAALADWAVEEGIYDDSIKTAEGKLFLHWVGLENDKYKLFDSVNNNRVEKRKCNEDNMTAAKKKRKKKSNTVAVSRPEDTEKIAELEGELDEIVHSHTKPAAKPVVSKGKDSSPMKKKDEMDGKSSDEEEGSEDGGNYDQGDQDENEQENDDVKAAASATNDLHSSEDEMSYKSPEEDSRSSFDVGRYDQDQDDEDYEYEEDDTSNDQTVEYHPTEGEEEEDDESRRNQDQPAPNETALHEESNLENDVLSINRENDEDVSDLEDEFNGAAVSSSEKNNDGRVAVARGNQAKAMAKEIEELQSKLKANSESEATLRTELQAKNNELESAQEEINRLRRKVSGLKAAVQNLSDSI